MEPLPKVFSICPTAIERAWSFSLLTGVVAAAWLGLVGAEVPAAAAVPAGEEDARPGGPGCPVSALTSTGALGLSPAAEEVDGAGEEPFDAGVRDMTEPFSNLPGVAAGEERAG